jgi:hypothetical protein
VEELQSTLQKVHISLRPDFLPPRRDSNSLYVSQISTCSVQANKASLQTTIASLNHVPTKESWDLAVTKALQMIKGRQRELVKVSRSVNFDPIILTAKSISGFRGCHFI